MNELLKNIVHLECEGGDQMLKDLNGFDDVAAVVDEFAMHQDDGEFALDDMIIETGYGTRRMLDLDLDDLGFDELSD
ncbi:MAG: hypothetical protein ACR2PO_21045 [Methyloligellaceae bacterium]